VRQARPGKRRPAKLQPGKRRPAKLQPGKRQTNKQPGKRQTSKQPGRRQTSKQPGSQVLTSDRLATRTKASPAGAGQATEQPVDEFASRVLDLVESIPAGTVMSYGDIAEYLGTGGPRQVGRVMALWGGAVPWWRVVAASGTLLAGHERKALARYRAEGTPLRRRSGGDLPRIDMRQARWHGGPAAAAD